MLTAKKAASPQNSQQPENATENVPVSGALRDNSMSLSLARGETAANDPKDQKQRVSTDISPASAEHRQRAQQALQDTVTTDGHPVMNGISSRDRSGAQSLNEHPESHLLGRQNAAPSQADLLEEVSRKRKSPDSEQELQKEASIASHGTDGAHSDVVKSACTFNRFVNGSMAQDSQSDPLQPVLRTQQQNQDDAQSLETSQMADCRRPPRKNAQESGANPSYQLQASELQSKSQSQPPEQVCSAGASTFLNPRQQQRPPISSNPIMNMLAAHSTQYRAARPLGSQHPPGAQSFTGSLGSLQQQVISGQISRPQSSTQSTNWMMQVGQQHMNFYRPMAPYTSTAQGSSKVGH